MERRWKIKAQITILDQFTAVVIVKAPNETVAKIRGYNKLKKKYNTATKINVINIKEV